MAYAFKPGSYLPTSLAPEAGKQCDTLASEGKLTAHNMVEINRPEEAPLHPVFEWDDSVAGEKWREHQARHVINAIIVVNDETPKTSPVRAYYHIERGEPQYHRIDVILSDEEQTEKLLRQAKNELEAFRDKYHTLERLAPVFEAIDALNI